MRVTSINGVNGEGPTEVESISLVGDRKNNQDRAQAFVDETRLLLVLADGMGGHSDGALAAQCVVEEAERLFNSEERLAAVPLMQRIALQAHMNIVRLNPHLPDRQQPRTTVVMAHVENGRAIFTHAGDSRAYLVRDGQVLCRTRDHSVVEAMVRRGEITEEEARHHPVRNQVSRCLGGLHRPAPLEVTPCPLLKSGDRFVLCSDGFWEPLTDPEICSNLSLEELANVAIERNAFRADNTTALRSRVQNV